MPDALPAGLIAEAVKLGLLAPDASLHPLQGANADRRTPARRTWLARNPAGQGLLLSTGPRVRAQAHVQTEFARACPALVHPPRACLSTPEGDLLVEEYSPAPALSCLQPDSPAAWSRISAGLAAAVRALAQTEAASTESARQAEWQEWADTLTSLPCWLPAETELLRTRILPRLYPLLARGKPVTRWSNGDFTAGNLLLDESARPHLIDLEHARETHFFTEDAARFHALSALARAHPDRFTPMLPRPGPAWHLYFWLRQVGLECAHNTEAYLATVLPRRRAVIRRLAEQVLGLDLAGWSVPAVPVHSAFETGRWHGDGRPRLLLAGWAHAPGSPAAGAVLLHDGDGFEIAAAPLRDRPDVARHFAGAAGSGCSGFLLKPELPAPDLTLQLSLLDGEGTMLPFHSLQARDLPGRGPFIAHYRAWALRHDPDPPAPATPSGGPKLSILLPVYRSDPAFLRACVDSVRMQHHRHWELVVADDGSGSPALTALLADFAAADARIRVLQREENRGIARTTNEALAAATGEFAVFVDHDDLLRPHALAELAAALQRDPATDVLYSDEEKISATGERLLPFLKPAFSPEFLRGVMYPGHVLCVRRALAHEAGGLDPAYDGVQDFEFFLRLTETCARIVHLPRILYQWRQAPTSSALHGNIKGDMDRRQAHAVQAHLQRIGDPRHAIALGGHRLRLEATASPRWEIVTCDDPDQAVAALRAAAAASTAEILVLLPRPVRPDDEAWLREVAALAARPDSAFVGPLLVNAAGRVAASGLTPVGGKLVPVMAGFDAAGDGYNGSLRCNREVFAVPPSGAAVRRELMSSLPVGTPHDWAGISRALTSPGRFNRVCAAARLELPAPVSALPASSCAPLADPYYNPHFAPPPGSYQLAHPPAHLPPPAPAVLFHFDELPAAFLNDGCATLRGWCFRRDGRPVILRVRSGRSTWPAACVQPRPDVARAHPPGLTDGHCGFSLRFVLPAGSHALIVESLSGTDAPELLATLGTVVPPFPSLRRLLSPHPPSLLAHQLPAWPAHAPRWLRPERFPTTRDTAPSLTIVTPSYQQGAFLDETIRSVLHDAPPGLAYVVQDGGSTDGSVDIIARWARNYSEAGGRRQEAGNPSSTTLQPPVSSLQPPVSSLQPPTNAQGAFVWSSEADRGQADAIAKGFGKTSGGPDDLMAWINSDDFYLPGALRFVADYFARHPDVDVVYGHRVLVDENSQEIGRWFLPRHDPEVLRLNDFVPQETLFWRRRIWDRVGGLDTSFKFAMDWDLLLRFQAAGAKIVRVPYFLACFRIHAAQKTSAQIHSVGQAEIDRLRERTFGRPVPPAELEANPRLLRYLHRSAFIEFLWKLGLRAP